MEPPDKEPVMSRPAHLHHTPIRRDDGAWTICDVANLLPMAAVAARYWRDSGRRRHA
jgi:hypothetical protein